MKYLIFISILIFTSSCGDDTRVAEKAYQCTVSGNPDCICHADGSVAYCL